MKYLLFLSILLMAVFLAGCTEEQATASEETTIEASVFVNETTTTTANETATIKNETVTTLIKLGETCTDTDNGKDYAVKGTVEYPRAPIGLTKATDKCISNTTLQEYYCEKQTGVSYDYVINYERHVCSKLCYNGICVNETSE